MIGDVFNWDELVFIPVGGRLDGDPTYFCLFFTIIFSLDRDLRGDLFHL